MTKTAWTELPQTIIQSHDVDPDRRRRAETLNILLLASFVISVLALLSTFALEIAQVFPPSETVAIYIPSGALALMILGIYRLNRIYPLAAGTAFLLVLVVLLSISDSPEEIAGGRAQLFLSLPIIMASIVLPAWSSFLFAGLVSLVVNLIGLSVTGLRLTPFSTFAYLIIALVSYLGASQLEQALSALRIINRDLDRRVEERTRELRQANEQLARANERLRELDRLKSRFVSMVSHELRTPLSAIQGFAEMLLAEIYGPLSGKQQNALTRITTNAERLLQLVSDLLDQARIEAGQVTIREEALRLADLVEDVYATMEVLAAAKGLTLTTEIGEDVPEMINGDEERLRQILVNLINNAIKFTDDGGVKVRLYRACGVHRPDAARDSHGTHTLHGGRVRDGDGWALAVSDTGPGIAEKDRALVFDPFRRVDDSSTREHLGVGLGLSIAKELVELMGGEISFSSVLGQGSTFTVVLPLEPQGRSTDA